MKKNPWIVVFAIALAVGAFTAKNASAVFVPICDAIDVDDTRDCEQPIPYYYGDTSENDGAWDEDCKFNNRVANWEDSSNSSKGSLRKSTVSGRCNNRYLVCYEKTSNFPKKCAEVPPPTGGANDFMKCTNLTAKCDTSTGCPGAAYFHDDCNACVTAYADTTGTCTTSTLINSCWSSVGTMALATSGVSTATCTTGSASSTAWACNCSTSGCDATCNGTWGAASSTSK